LGATILRIVEEEMIKVDKREQIRRAYYVEEKSIRQIARELRHSRDTVKKAIESAEPATYTLKKPWAAGESAWPTVGALMHTQQRASEQTPECQSCQVSLSSFPPLSGL